jgi:mannose-6-phosphate isomerase-like protein (cupin superfamily)
MMILALVLGLALQQPPAKPSTQSTRKPAPPPAATLELKVTDRKGAPIAGAEVTVEGPSAREGTSDANGSIVFRNMTAGAYRSRVQRNGFITLEKEATIRAGAPFLVEVALSPAPPPPLAAKPQPAAEPPPALAAGLARALAIDDALLRARLPGREPVERLSVGCSGATASEVLRLRDGLESHTHTDADEVLYLVAGEGTLTLGSQDVKVGPGWYSLVPRGVAHALVRSGRNPIVLLSVVSGQPCSAAALAP